MAWGPACHLTGVGSASKTCDLPAARSDSRLARAQVPEGPGRGASPKGRAGPYTVGTPGTVLEGNRTSDHGKGWQPLGRRGRRGQEEREGGRDAEWAEARGSEQAPASTRDTPLELWARAGPALATAARAEWTSRGRPDPRSLLVNKELGGRVMLVVHTLHGLGLGSAGHRTGRYFPLPWPSAWSVQGGDTGRQAGL